MCAAIAAKAKAATAMSSMVERRTLRLGALDQTLHRAELGELLVDGLERLVGQPDKGALLALDGIEADLQVAACRAGGR